MDGELTKQCGVLHQVLETTCEVAKTIKTTFRPRWMKEHPRQIVLCLECYQLSRPLSSLTTHATADMICPTYGELPRLMHAHAVQSQPTLTPLQSSSTSSNKRNSTRQHSVSSPPCEKSVWRH
jgi:hypothetical protein